MPVMPTFCASASTGVLANDRPSSRLRRPATACNGAVNRDHRALLWHDVTARVRQVHGLPGRPSRDGSSLVLVPVPVRSLIQRPSWILESRPSLLRMLVMWVSTVR